MPGRASEILFGYDVFISYARADAEKYAETLQAKLESTDVAVFRDRTHLDSGQDLGGGVRKAIGRSRRFVLIDTPAARQSAWVAREIEFFLGQASEGLISIRMPNTSDGQPWPRIANRELWTQIDGFNWELECTEALEHGNPSDRVIKRIQGAISTLRVRKLMRGAVIGVIVTLASLLAFSLYETSVAVKQRERAVARQLASESMLAERDDYLAVELSALLAAESARRTLLPENDERMRQILRILPTILGEFEQPGHPDAVLCSAKGELGIIATQSGVVSAHNLPGLGKRWELKHADSVEGLAFSPDGRYLATASQDGTLRIVEAATGNERLRKRINPSKGAIAYAPDGMSVLIGTQDGPVSLIRASDGAPIWNVRGEPVVNSVAMSSDGRWAIAGTSEQSMFIIDARIGRLAHVIRHPSIVNAVAISADGRFVASGGFDNEARLFDMPSGKLRAELKHGGSVEDVTFSPDGNLLATASQDHNARLFDVATGNMLAEFPHQDYVQRVKFDKTGRWLLTASMDRTARVFDVIWQREVARQAHKDVVFDAAFLPGSRSVLSASHFGDCRLFRFDPGPELLTARHSEDVLRAALSLPENKLVAAGRLNAPVMFSLGQNEPSSTVLKPPMVTWLASSKTGLVAVGSYRDGAWLFRGTNAERLSTGYSAAGAFSEDGKSLATLDESHIVRVFHVASPGAHIVATIEPNEKAPAGPPNPAAAAAIAISSDRAWIAASGEGAVPKVIDAKSGRPVRNLNASGSIGVLALSPDGKYLVSGDSDGNMSVTECVSGAGVFAVKHGSRVTAAAFNTSGKLLATGAEDGEVRVFSFTDGAELTRIENAGKVLAVSFGSDAIIRIAIARANYIGVLDFKLGTNALVAEICGRVSRNLTPAEWRAHVGSLSYEKTCAVK